MITQTTIPGKLAGDSLRNSAFQFPQCLPDYLALLRSLPLSNNGVSDSITMLGVTSCYRGEGVSTVVTQLSLAAVSSGLRVLIVDLNATRPILHRTFNTRLSPGLTDVLIEAEEIDAAVQGVHVPSLSLLTLGSSQSDFQRLASSERMSELLQELRPNYDLVVCDLPASAHGGADLMLARLMDGILLVIESERVRWEVAMRVQQLLNRSGARVLGAVLNKRRQTIPNWLYRTL